MMSVESVDRVTVLLVGAQLLIGCSRVEPPTHGVDVGAAGFDNPGAHADAP
jgi:hypothetical protein